MEGVQLLREFLLERGILLLERSLLLLKWFLNLILDLESYGTEFRDISRLFITSPLESSDLLLGACSLLLELFFE